MADKITEKTFGTNGYEPLDECFGIVECCSRSGAYLHLDNGTPAFAYGTANLREGIKVLCTVKKPARGDLRMTVTVDSVLWDEYDAA